MRSLQLLLVFLFAGTAALAFQPGASAMNDSARYHIDRSNTRLARSWVERALKAPGTDRDKAWSHVLLGNIDEEEGYLASTFSEYRQAAELARASNAKDALAAALNGLAASSTASGKYDSVILMLDESRQLDKSGENLVRNYQVLGRFHQAKNQYDEALADLQKALDEANKLKDRRQLALIYSNIGGIHFTHTPGMKEAISYLLKSIEYCDSSIHYNILARNYGRLGNANMVLGNGPEAKAYLDRAHKISDLSGNLPVRAYILSSQATFMFGEEKYAEAIAYLEEPIRIKRQLGQVRQLQNDLINISEAYMMVKRYKDANSALEEATGIAHQLDDIIYLKYCYDRRATLDSILGNYKSAYSNLKRSKIYQDSTFSAQHIKDVREVQEKYETEQKEKIIAQQELQLEQNRLQKTLIIGICLIVVMLLGGAVVLIRIRSKARLQIQTAKFQKLQLQTIVQTQEQVQQRIARDLHDGLVQVLGAAKMTLQSVTPGNDSAIIHKQIRGASDIIDEAVTEARSLSHQILPYSLIKNGLVSALDELFGRSLPTYRFDHPAELESLTENQAINIFRIAQEIVNNIQKHSRASEVNIQLTNTGKSLVLTVRENGIGFDMSKASGGAGLSNMTTRAAMINGTIDIRSAPGSGTTIQLTVPL